MFDTIAGLPVHVLVVHVVVVLGPLAALATVAYLLLTRRRGALRWPTVGLALVAAGSAWVAEESGERFERRLASIGRATDLISEHTDAGEDAKVALLVLAGVVLLVTLVLAPPSGSTPLVRAVPAYLLGLGAAAFAAYAVFVAGHSGSTAVWSELVRNTTG